MAPRAASPFASPRPLRSPRSPAKAVKRNISLADLADADPSPDFLDESREQLRKEATSLLNDAQEAMDGDAMQAAERAATDALNLFREIGDRGGIARSLRCIVSAYQAREELENAYLRASEELDRCRNNGNQLGEAAMMMSLVELKMLQAVKPKEVVSMAKAALALVQPLQDKPLKAEALLTLAQSYEHAQKSDHMMRAARAALEAFRQLGDKRGEAKSLHFMALAAGLCNDMKEAVRCSNQACSIYRQMGLHFQEAAELMSLAEWHKMNKDDGLMLQAAEDAMAIYRRQNSLLGQSNVLRLLVKAHCLIEDDQKGLEVAEAALNEFRDQHYKRGEAIALDQIGSVLYGMRRPQEALEAATEALDLIKSLEDLPWEAIMLHSVAALHCTLKHYPEALQAAQEAIWILEDIGDRSGQAYVRLNTILQVQTQLQEYPEALSTAEEAVAIFKEIKDRRGEATALLLAANVYKSVGELDEAEKWLQEAQEIFTDMGERRLLAQVIHSMAKVHIAKNEPAEAVRLAYEAHSLCKRARDKPAEAGTLLFTVEAHLSLIAQLVENGRVRGSRELEEQLSKAERAGQAAKKIADKLGHKQTIADCFYAMSEVNLVSGKYQEALDGADEGIKIYQDVGYALGECTFVNMKAQALLVSGKNDEALVAAKEAVSMAKAMEDKSLEALAQEILEKVLQGQGQPQGPRQPQMPLPQMEEEQEEAPAAAAASEVVEEKPKGLEPAIVHDMLHNMLREMMGSEMEADTPFMDAGVDSLMSIEFRSQVNSAFSGLGLSSTLTFDYPTIRELTGHIVEKSHNQ
ncbi:unnamed protein product [Effrenium voratum]|uniref:Carrier domain-containing protein n=1 Tax=Effrenium voratum TaxID=2562239 RepID=A0AA36J238_9DINO|nr:unnamed protein product [Effrenium voratum]